MQNQTLVETLTTYIKITFKKVGQNELAIDQFAKELINKIFTEIFENLIQQRIKPEEQEQFAKNFIENSQNNLNAFFDQLARLIRSDDLQKTVIEKTNQEIERILSELIKTGEVKEQDIDRLQWFLKNPGEFHAMDKLLQNNPQNTNNLPEDLLRRLSGN